MAVFATKRLQVYAPAVTTSTAGPTNRIFDGWRVVASVFILLVVNAGIGFYGLAIYLDAITDEQGFSTGSVSFATSLYFVVSAIAGRMIAPVIETRDVRYVVAVGGVVSALGIWLIGQSTSLLTLYPSYFLFAIGAGFTGLVPATTLVTRWFQVRRSVALSVASTGLSVGGLTLTLLASRLIDTKGMAGATPWLALVYLVVVAISLPMLWPTQESRGTVPDGPEVATATGAVAGPAVDYDAAVASMFFKLATVAFVLTMGAQVGGIAQLAKLGTERIDRPTGALAVSSIALASVIARLVGGFVATRVRLITMTWVLAGLQGLALVWISQIGSKAPLLAAALLFGCTIGNLLMLQPLVVADRFGVAHYPRIFALQQLIVLGFGVGAGPYLLGILRDLASYEVSYIVAGGMSLAGSAVFFLASRQPEVS